MSKEQQIPEIDRLFYEVEWYQSEIKKLLKFVAKFPKISAYNAMLVYIQKPGSKYVATIAQWKKFKRKPKPGARPLVILRTYGPISFVYELDDTEGEPLPKNIEQQFYVDGKMSDQDYNKFVEGLRYEGIKVVEQSDSIESDKKFRTINETAIYHPDGQSPKRFRLNFELAVNSKYSNMNKMISILDTVAHIFCGHFEHEHSNIYYREKLPIVARKWEAQIVCWLVCERLVIYAIKYRRFHLELGEGKITDYIRVISFFHISKAVSTLEAILKGAIKKPNKALII